MWHRFVFNIQNIKRETEKAVLIAFPHRSELDGFAFWLPKKLVRTGSDSYQTIGSIADDMEIRASKYSEKTRRVLAEKRLSPEDVVDIFGGKTMARAAVDSCRRQETPHVETHVPTPIAPKEREVLDADLVR